MRASSNKCKHMGSFLFRSQGSFLIPWRSSAASHLSQPPDLLPVSSSAWSYLSLLPSPWCFDLQERGILLGDWSRTVVFFFFFFISVEDGHLRRGKKDLLVKGNQPWQCHIAYFYICARALCWRLRCAPGWTWKPKSWCSEGLAKPWSELYFSWWGFPRSEPRLIGSKEKRIFHSRCPLGRLSEELRTFAHSAKSPAHFTRLFPPEVHILEVSVMYNTACCDGIFWKTKIKGFLSICIPWFLTHPSWNTFCVGEYVLFCSVIPCKDSKNLKPGVKYYPVRGQCN